MNRMKTPKKNGQIWDECPQCGREPIYLPLELCDDCWPQGESYDERPIDYAVEDY